MPGRDDTNRSPGIQVGLPPARIVIDFDAPSVNLLLVPQNCVLIIHLGQMLAFGGVRFVGHSDPVLIGELAADANGVVDGELALPAALPPGPHTLVASGKDQTGADVTRSMSIVVVAAAAPSAPGAPAQIAFTGSNSTNPAALGAILVVTGFAATLAARRRIMFSKSLPGRTDG